MTDVYCTNCGHRNPDGSNFCSSCGAALETAAGDDRTVTLTVGDPSGAPDDELEVPLDDPASETATLVIKRGPGAGSRYVLDKDVIAAGRHPESDIFLDDVTVSRRHAEVVRDGHAYRVRDVGSLNGTYLNRARIEAEADLANGDEVQVGRFKLVFLNSSGTAS